MFWWVQKHSEHAVYLIKWENDEGPKTHESTIHCVLKVLWMRCQKRKRKLSLSPFDVALFSFFFYSLLLLVAFLFCYPHLTRLLINFPSFIFTYLWMRCKIRSHHPTCKSVIDSKYGTLKYLISDRAESIFFWRKIDCNLVQIEQHWAANAIRCDFIVQSSSQYYASAFIAHQHIFHSWMIRISYFMSLAHLYL